MRRGLTLLFVAACGGLTTAIPPPPPDDAGPPNPSDASPTLEASHDGAIAPDAFADVLWARQLHVHGDSAAGHGIASDAVGHVIVGGAYKGVGDFGDTGALAGAGFVGVWDTAGSVVWDRLFVAQLVNNSIGGTAVSTVTTDSLNHVIAGGSIAETANIGIVATGSHQGSCFISEFDDTGQSVFVKVFGRRTNASPEECVLWTVTTDAKNNIYVAGWFEATIDFGNGITISASPSSNSAFLAKLDPTGAPIWAKAYGSTAQVCRVTPTALGNVVISGDFVGSIDLGAGGMQASSGAGDSGDDILLAKLDGNGNVIWNRHFPTEKAPYTFLWDHNVDDVENVIVAGTFGAWIDLGTGPTAGAAGNPNAFIADLDASGTLAWMHTYGATGAGADARAIRRDSSGDIVVMGRFVGGVDLGEGTEPDYGTSMVYLMKLAQDGTQRALRVLPQSGGPGVSWDDILALDSTDHPLLSGSFDGTLDWGSNVLTSPSNQDAFVAKIAPLP